jgi:hypothetical protein
MSARMASPSSPFRGASSSVKASFRSRPVAAIRICSRYGGIRAKQTLTGEARMAAVRRPISTIQTTVAASRELTVG